MAQEGSGQRNSSGPQVYSLGRGTAPNLFGMQAIQPVGFVLRGSAPGSFRAAAPGSFRAAARVRFSRGGAGFVLFSGGLDGPDHGLTRLDGERKSNG